MKYLLSLFLVVCGAAHAAVPPPCWPKIAFPPALTYGLIPQGISTVNDSYAVWVCNTPQGYATIAMLFNQYVQAVAVFQYVAGQITPAQANLQYTNIAVPFTPAEDAYALSLIAKYRPKATVGYSALSATRAVYTVTSTGARSTAVAGESVAVTRPCNETDAIPGTAYYSVAGQPNALKAGTVLPAGSYSNCTLVFPIAPN